MFLFWQQHASLTLTEGVATSEFFTHIWQPDHPLSLSFGTVWETALVTRYRPSMATSCQDGRTLMNHLLPYGTRVSTPFWSSLLDLLFICVPAGTEQSLAGRFNFFAFYAGLIWFHSPKTFSSDGLSSTTMLTSSTAETGSTMRAQTDGTKLPLNSLVCFHQQKCLTSSRPSLVCIPQKRSLTSECWNVQRPDGPPWQPLHPWKASLSAKISWYQSQILLLNFS